jgi:hypothetical protein
MLIAAAAAAPTLPEKTTLGDFVTFMRKVVGEPKQPRAFDDRPLGPGFVADFDVVDLGFSENTNAGKTIDDVLAGLIKEFGGQCDNFQTQPVARQSAAIAILRSSYTCRVLDDGYGEMIVITDGTRYQTFDFIGLSRDKQKIVILGAKIYDALLVAYR